MVISTFRVEQGSGATGKLHILNYLGGALQEIDLPTFFYRGLECCPDRSQPANIDGDPDLEVGDNTAHSGFAANDLPGKAGPYIFWWTGRGNCWRDGYLP
jgi:hypothetical protein